jgi:hypothetical protein
MRIPFDTKVLHVGAAAAMPGRLSGRITGTVPADRLGVVSIPSRDDSAERFTYLVYRGPVTLAQPDGSYELREPPGKRTVVVIDLLTGVILARAPETEVAARQTRRLDFQLDAARLDLSIGGDGWRPGLGFELEVRPAIAAWREQLGGILTYTDFPCGLGCDLAPGTQKVRLWLPPAQFVLLLREWWPRNLTKDRPLLASATLEPKPEGQFEAKLDLAAK